MRAFVCVSDEAEESEVGSVAGSDVEPEATSVFVLSCFELTTYGV